MPAIAAVHGLPDATGRGAGVVRVRVAGNASDRSDAIPYYRTNKTKVEAGLLVFLFTFVLGCAASYQQKYTGE